MYTSQLPVNEYTCVRLNLDQKIYSKKYLLNTSLVEPFYNRDSSEKIMNTPCKIFNSLRSINK